jgi:hypothetical protein
MATSRSIGKRSSRSLARKKRWSSSGVQNAISGALAAFADGGVAASDGLRTIKPFRVASASALRRIVCTYRTVRGLRASPSVRMFPQASRSAYIVSRCNGVNACSRIPRSGG